MNSKHCIYTIVISIVFSCKSDPNCNLNLNNAGNQVYILSEATCFISLKLEDKSPRLELIEKALLIEEEFMDQAGLLSSEPIPQFEQNSNIELSIDELIQYALKDETLELSKDDLLNIYDKEIEYLKFIGLVVE